MTRTLPFALAVLIVATVSAQDADISAAIKAGTDRKYGHLISSCSAQAGWGQVMAAGASGGIQPTGHYNVWVSREFGRIAMLAADAKRLYRPFGLEQITPEMLVPAVYVTAIPENPRRASNVYHVGAPLESVVLKSKVNENTVAQALDLQITPVEWKNLLGATFSGTTGVARFDLATVRAFPAGEFDIVLITTAGERRCKVGEKDRQRVIG